VVSAVQAQHDSVGHLLEGRCAAATGEVFKALRERVRRSIEDADVIERKDLAGFSAPLDSFLRVDAHDRTRKRRGQGVLRVSFVGRVDPALARARYSRLEGLAATVREYCRPLRKRKSRIRQSAAIFYLNAFSTQCWGLA